MAAEEIRQNQIATAQANPNILTSLSGASTPGPMQAPAQPVSSVPGFQQTQQTAQEMSQALYGGSFVPGAEAQREQQLQALFSYDQQLEQGYSPFPQVPGYVENPADLYRSAGGYAAGVGGIMGALSGAQSSIEKGYDTAMSSVLDKLMDLLNLQEKRKQAEEDKAYKEEQLKMDRERLELERQRLSSGGGLSVSERTNAKLASQVEQDVANRMTPKDLFAKYGGLVDFNTIMDVYNSSSPWGAAKETMQELRQLYETAGGALSSSKVAAGTTGGDLRSQIAAMGTGGERQAAILTADMWTLADRAQKMAEGDIDTGPVSGRITKFRSRYLGLENENVELQRALGEIVNAIRKDTTGVAFAPAEQEAIIDRIGDIVRQEGNIRAGLNYAKQRFEDKLGLMGISIPDSSSNIMSDLSGSGSVILRDPSTGKVYEYDSANDPDYINDINLGFERF